MSINEIEALKTALEKAGEINISHLSAITILIEEDIWEVEFMPERVIRIDSKTGKVQSNSDILSPIDALTKAKEYAASNSLNWRPAFSLQLEEKSWRVGSCQSQLGGQVYIHVDHAGKVFKHFVNPK